MTDHEPLADLDLSTDRPRRGRGRSLAIAAAAVLLVGLVAVIAQGDDGRVRVELDEALPDLEPGLLRPLGPRDGKDSIRLPLTVEPSTGLRDGQAIAVSASGFEPGEQVGLVQCAREAGGDTPETRGGIDGCLISPYVNVTADEDGRASGVYEVRRVLTTPLTGTVDCAAEADRCIVAMGALNDYDRSGGHGIEFAPGGAPVEIPTVEVAPREGLADGDLVHIVAVGLTPNTFATIEICSSDPSACWQTGELTTVDHSEGGELYTERLVGLPVDGSGRLEGDVPVWRYLPGGEPGTYVDCAISRCSLRTSGETAPPTVPLGFTAGGDGPEAPTLAVDPSRDLAPGDDVVVRGVGFAPGTRVWISLCAKPVDPADEGYGTCASSQDGAGRAVDVDGTFEQSFEIPELGRFEAYPGEGCTSDQGCTSVSEPGTGAAIRCDGIDSACEVTVEIDPYAGPVPTRPVFHPHPVTVTFR